MAIRPRRLRWRPWGRMGSVLLLAVASGAGAAAAGGPSGPLLAQNRTGSGAARPDPALVQAAARMAAPFRLSSADRARGCAFELRGERAGRGFALAFDKAACAVIPFTAEVSAWQPDAAGAVRLLSTSGEVVAEFTPATAGAYEALREGDGVYFLIPPGAASDEVRPEEVLGEWVLGRALGTPLCRLTFTDRPVPGGLALELAPGCDGALFPAPPTAWRVDGGNILLLGGGKGVVIRFAVQEDGSWARVPERGRPLLMARP